MMSKLSIAQKQYILSQKKHRRTVRIGRSSICILFYSFGNLLPMPGSSIPLFSAVLLKL